MEPKLEGKEANFRCNLDLVHYVALNLKAKFMPYNLKMGFVLNSEALDLSQVHIVGVI